MNNLIAIAAQYSNGVIGVDNSLPFTSPTDMDYFKQQTLGNVVIMGNNTYKSLKCKSLPGRVNIVVTSSNYLNNDVHTVKSLTQAIELANMHYSDCKHYIIGGQSIYHTMVPSCDELHLTVFNQPYHANQTDNLVFFPYTNAELQAIFTNREIVSTFIDQTISGTIYKYTKDV